MYQALYRKWRPRVFDDVAGQSHITETLKSQVKTGRLSHAYLFIGTRGTGKTTCAKILARAVNCEDPRDGNPCNHCDTCLGIESGSILDVVELDAASNNGVDNVRALRDEAIFSPASAKMRVYIVDEVHMLSTSAFNALLKILEEPPPHLMFILATTESHKVPATILSRCQRHSFRRIDPAVIEERLIQVADSEGIKLTPGAAGLLSRLADGAMRDALSLLDQCSGSETVDEEAVLSAMGLTGSHRLTELFGKIVGGDTRGALELFDRLWRDGKSPSALLMELQSLMRDVLILHIAPKGGQGLLSGSFDTGALKSIGGKLPASRLLSDISLISDALGGMRDTSGQKIAAELCLISLCEPATAGGIRALNARVSELESRLESGIPVSCEASSTPPAAAPFPALSDEAEPDAGDDEEYSPPWLEGKPDDATPWEEEDEEAGFSSARICEPPSPEAGREPECLPEPEASGQAESSGAAGLDSGSIDALVKRIKGKLDIGSYNLLTDSLHTELRAENGGLVVAVRNGFAFALLSKPAVIEAIRSTASELGCGAVSIIEDEGKASEKPPGNSKLDALLGFGNVTIE